MPLDLVFLEPVWLRCGFVVVRFGSRWFRNGSGRAAVVSPSRRCMAFWKKTKLHLESCLLRALPVQRSSLSFKATFLAGAQESIAPTHQKRKHTKHVKLLYPCQVH